MIDHKFNMVYRKINGRFQRFKKSAELWKNYQIEAVPSRLSADELKEKFRENGITFADWAAENGYTRQEVYRVVNGLVKARYGKAHEIAVKLGLKPKPAKAA